eukprot:476150-Hanusia_phi.AAC.2
MARWARPGAVTVTVARSDPADTGRPPPGRASRRLRHGVRSDDRRECSVPTVRLVVVCFKA